LVIWGFGDLKMEDRDLENLLRRYRPAGPSDALFDQITKSPDHENTKSSWPWAVAAAALLAISVGLHAAVASVPDPSAVVDAQRIQAISEELGGGPGSEVMAEWMARREARAEREARMARAVAPEIGRQ
jgi:hypothetical protein